MLTPAGTREITTERLLLRPFMLSDGEAMLKNWIADEKIQSMYCEPIYSTKDEVRKLLCQYIDNYSKKDYYRWAIVLRENGECIGQIAFFLVDSENHFAEIEYCVGGQYQRRGLATEATKAIIRFGFEQIGLHKIQICHKSNNIASKRVIEKCGFVYEGTLRDYFYTDGNYVGRCYYSLLRDEYFRK